MLIVREWVEPLLPLNLMILPMSLGRIPQASLMVATTSNSNRYHTIPNETLEKSDIVESPYGLINEVVILV